MMTVLPSAQPSTKLGTKRQQIITTDIMGLMSAEGLLPVMTLKEKERRLDFLTQKDGHFELAMTLYSNMSRHAVYLSFNFGKLWAILACLPFLFSFSFY